MNMSSALAGAESVPKPRQAADSEENNSPPINVLTVAPFLNPADQRTLTALAELARDGRARQMLLALNLVRRSLDKAKGLAASTSETDPAHQVLTAALAVHGSAMITEGLQPSADVKRALERDTQYLGLRHAADRALRTEAYRVEEFRYYTVGALAVMAASFASEGAEAPQPTVLPTQPLLGTQTPAA